MAIIDLATLRDYWKGVYDTVATVGSAALGKAIQIAGTDGTNTRVIKTDSSGNVNTVLTGSVVVETAILNAVAISDTTTRSTTTIDLTAGVKTTLLVDNQHDKEVTLTVQDTSSRAMKRYNSTTSTWDSISFNVPANTARYYVLNELPGFKELFSTPIKNIRIAYQAPVAPVSGSITLLAWGGR